jgi:hypothetical protein
MAALYPCSLCRVSEVVQKKLETNKKPFLIYSIFAILLIEWFSFFYIKYFHVTTERITDYYVTKMYPFLTQLCLLILFFSLFLWKDRLHFCFRKTAVTFYLSCYYFINCFAIVFCLNSSIYYEILSYGVLGIASLLFVVSLKNNVK